MAESAGSRNDLTFEEWHAAVLGAVIGLFAVVGALVFLVAE